MSLKSSFVLNESNICRASSSVSDTESGLGSLFRILYCCKIRHGISIEFNVVHGICIWTSSFCKAGPNSLVCHQDHSLYLSNCHTTGCVRTFTKYILLLNACVFYVWSHNTFFNLRVCFIRVDF